MIKINGKIDNTNFEDLDIIKKYFSKIFAVLSPEIRETLTDLNVSIEKKNIIKKELAFLEKKKQIEYLEELYIIWNRVLKGF